MQSDNRTAIAVRLSDFKENGIVQYQKTLEVPFSQRIPQLIKGEEGRETVIIALSVALRNALNNLNLKYPMNEDQIVDLADMIIDQSHEDQLSLEDVVLFLQKMIAGECGEIEFKMDAPTFFHLFEVYRQERHDKLQQIKYERHSSNKIAGRGNEREMPKDGNDAHTMLDLLKTFHEPDGEQI